MRQELTALKEGRIKHDVIEELFALRDKENVSETISDLPYLDRDRTMVLEIPSREVPFAAHNLYNANDQLDILSQLNFAFCTSQIGQINRTARTALEIGYILAMSPFIIAVYIEKYGTEWAQRLMTPEFLLRPERGLKGCYFNVSGDLFTIERRLERAFSHTRCASATRKALLDLGTNGSNDRLALINRKLEHHKINVVDVGDINTYIFKNSPSGKVTTTGKRRLQVKCSLTY